ncbi:MAG TPA: hypothetical protein VJ717_10670 [Gemmatimonadaceae bacterium]|nr:hypothetical protein [Gemmatimonadaceae bacterium]
MATRARYVLRGALVGAVVVAVFAIWALMRGPSWPGLLYAAWPLSIPSGYLLVPLGNRSEAVFAAATAIALVTNGMLVGWIAWWVRHRLLGESRSR